MAARRSVEKPATCLNCKAILTPPKFVCSACEETRLKRFEQAVRDYRHTLGTMLKWRDYERPIESFAEARSARDEFNPRNYSALKSVLENGNRAFHTLACTKGIATVTDAPSSVAQKLLDFSHLLTSQSAESILACTPAELVELLGDAVQTERGTIDRYPPPLGDVVEAATILDALAILNHESDLDCLSKLLQELKVQRSWRDAEPKSLTKLGPKRIPGRPGRPPELHPIEELVAKFKNSMLYSEASFPRFLQELRKKKTLVSLRTN